MRIRYWSSDVCPSDRGGYHLIVRPQRLAEALREHLPELLVEARHLKADALGLAHQPVDLLKGLGDFLKLREIDARQVLRLVDQHIRLVLKRDRKSTRLNSSH